MRHKYVIITTIGLVLWIAETAFFGWNEKPINGVERMLDTISFILIVWGILGDITSGLQFHKHYGGNENNYQVDKGELYFTKPPIVKINE